MPPRCWLWFSAACLMTVSTAAAQSVISAQSGLVHYTEGRVLLAGQPVEPKFAKFPSIKDNEELRTELGRAEVLLSPGVFLRVGENSGVRMVSSHLTDPRIEFLAGSIIIECNELMKDSAITVDFRGATISLRKHGLYRLDAEPPQLRVYDGEALVEAGDKPLVVKGNRRVVFDGALTAEKFDTEAGDPLSRWSRRRAEYVAMANLSAAKSLHDTNLGGWRSSGWLWNPYFGMFTFIPYRGIRVSPYGYRYWSPRDVYQVYEAPRAQVSSWEPSIGRPTYTTVAPTSSGTSGTVASAPPTGASSSGSASIPRETGNAGGGRR